MGVRFEVNLEPKYKDVIINKWLVKDSILKSIYHHMKGYPYYKLIHDSNFKVFTFSHLIGKQIKKIDNNHLLVRSSTKVIISTIDDCLTKHLINSFSKKPLLIGSTPFNATSVNILPDPDFKSLSKRDYVMILPIEPVNVIDTVKVDDKLKEIDIFPSNPSYLDKLTKSVIRKMEMIGLDTSKANFTLQIIKIIVEKSCSRYIVGKNKYTHIDRCGSMIQFRLNRNNTPQSLFENILKIIYYTGLGYNNTKGFGLVNIK